MITYLNIVLYALSYQLQSPVEPFMIKKLTETNADGTSGDVAQNYGNLQSFFSFCQFFGSPIVGILLDRIGIRATSCIVFGASTLSYAILSQARDLRMLFISKIPTIFQAAFLVAQATAAAATHGDSALRAAALGRMTTAYTVGATVGPALGGYLAESGDFYAGAKLAVVGSLVSVVLSILFLPSGKLTTDGSSTTKDSASSNETTTNACANRSLRKSKSSFAEDLKDSIVIALRPTIWPLLMVKVMGGVAASMHATAFPLVLTQSLGFEPAQLGFSMSCSMFSVAAFGAVAMAPLTKSFGSFGMMNIGLVTRSVLGLAMAVIVSMSTDSSETTMMRIIAISVLYSLSQHIIATGLTTQTTGSVDKDEQGALLGLEHSLFSLARIGGPAMGTFLLGAGGLWMVETACGSLDLVLAGSLAVVLPQAARRTKSS
jgi:predicted MFS family arabinose efflux permease